MLRSYLLLAGVTAASLALSVSGCGGVTEDPDGAGGKGTSSSSSGGGKPEVHAEPPAAATKAPDGTANSVFALRKLFLGDTNRDGTPNALNGWKQYGFDLDGKISTPNSTDLCKPRGKGVPKDVYPDGNNGIDNSFGKNILSLISNIVPDMSVGVQVNEGLAKGAFTIMWSMEKLGAGADYNPILTRLYAGATLPSPPLFDGTDKWPVRPELLTDPLDITTAKVQFDKSYLVKNTWVSGSKGNVDLDITVSGFSLKLSIASALVAMDLEESHNGAKNGTIAGVIATDALISELKRLVGLADPTLCTSATLEGIVAQVEAASDILQDGTQDAGKTCDGISIGIGFEASTVQLGAIADPAMPVADPCTKP